MSSESERYVRPEAWAAGPDRMVYEPLSRELVAASPSPLRGARVLDVGAGTGTTSRALREAGAVPYGFDLSKDMLAYDRDGRPPAVCGDVLALPFTDDAFDGVVAAFVVNHLEGPLLAVAEMARVTRPGGVVMASTFGNDVQHPARVMIDEVAVRFGYEAQEWYVRAKARAVPLTSDATSLEAIGREAGLFDVRVVERAVTTKVRTAADFVAYRLGMAQYAPFVSALSPDDRSALRAEAVRAVGRDPAPYRPTMLVLVGRR